MTAPMSRCVRSYHSTKSIATDFVSSADAQKSSAARRGCDDSDRRWRAAARHRRSKSLRPQTNFPHLPVTRQPRTKTHPVCPCEPLCAILLAGACVYSLSGVKANVSRLWEDIQSEIEMEL